MHVTTESNYNEDLTKSEATWACLSLRNQTNQHTKRTSYEATAPGSAWGVCTETMTIAYLEQKHNLESRNQVHLTLFAKMVEKKDETE